MKIISSLFLGVLLAGQIDADQWPQWRGPNGTGSSTATNLAKKWSTETGQNIKWQTPLIADGSSTPIVSEDAIFLTTSEGDDLMGYCFSRETGKIRWSKQLAKARMAERNMDMAAPSAVIDARHVYFLFGQGTLVALDFDGKQIWKKELEQEVDLFTQKFGHSSSPVLKDGVLYVAVIRANASRKLNPQGDPDSIVMAIDAASGDVRWKKDRPEEAVGAAGDSYSTPVIAPAGLIVSGGHVITCHDLSSGEEKWRFDYGKRYNGKKNWRLVSSPVIYEDLIIVPLPHGRHLIALDNKGQMVWDYTEDVPDIPSPTINGDTLYLLDGKRRYVSCMKAHDGKLIRRKKIESSKGFYASPTVADAKLYAINLDGEVFVFDLHERLKLLERIPMGGSDCGATIVAINKELYIRTSRQLICINKGANFF